MKHYNSTQNALKGIRNLIPFLSIFFLLLLSAGSNAQVNCATPLSGNYTINNTQVTGGTNFSSFTDFANALNCAGVSGPVVATAAIGSGPYDEQPQFNQVTGASATNTITINGNLVRLTKNIENAGGFSYGTILLNGVDYLTVNDLKIEALGQSLGYGVVLMNDASFNTFNNCIINAGMTTALTTSACVVMTGNPTNYSTPGINGSNNLFSGCTLTGGHVGFSFYGDGSNTLNSTNNRIENCTIKDFTQQGIILYVQDHAKVSGCTISRPVRSVISAGNAIQVVNFGTNILIEKNTIFNMVGAGFASSPSITGISMSSISSTPGNENIISNNLFYVNSNLFPHTTSQTIGINCQNSQYVKILHNTIAIDQPTVTGAQTSVSGIIAPLAGATIANNIVTVNRGGTGRKECLTFSNPPDICDNNNFSISVPSGSTQNNLVVFSGSTQTILYPDAALYRAAYPSMDPHSYFVNPNFVSPATGNYAFSNDSLNGIGRNVGVLTDITGASRAVNNPDPGAYEVTPAGLDASVQWISPLAPVGSGLTDVKVLVTNNRATLITSVVVSYSDGGAPISQTFPVNLTQGQSTVLTFTGQYNLTSAKTFTATLVNVNGVADDFSGNNTAVTSICVALSGNSYTINSALPTSGNNFQSFSSFVAALKCGGVAGPVTVTVSNGPFLEQVEIPEIAGTSAINRITIEGAGRTLTSPSFFSSATGATSAGTTITVNSTASFYVGMKVFVTAGTGVFAPGTTISSITDATRFVVSAAPSTALTGTANIVTGFFNAAYTSAAGATSSTTITVTSTTNLTAGMTVIVTAGLGSFPAGTTVASITDATHFEASAVPAVALSGGATIVSGFPVPASYISAAGATSSAATVTVASTAGLAVGMRVYVTSGAGSFAANTTVATINANGTTFTVSVNPSVALSGGAVVSAFPSAAPVYVSAAGATSAPTTINIASTIGLSPGMAVFVTSGAGLFAASTTIASITDATHFVVSSAPTIPLSGVSTVVSALNTPNALSPSTLLLSGVDYMTVNNLVIENAGTIIGSSLACHLWNGSDFNIFSGCTFRITQVPSLSQQNICPFSISCSPNTSNGTNGSAGGSFNKVIGCDLFSGYYGVALAGANTSVPPISGNEIINCTIRDAFATSMYTINSTGTVFSGNTIDRLTRTTSNNPYVGIQTNGGCTNLLVEKNWIKNTWAAVTPAATTPHQCIEIRSEGAPGKPNRFINNVISDINNFNGTLTGFQITQSNVSNLQIYHNTISFDNQLSTGSNTVTNGILCGSGLNTDIRNNIFYITRAGDGLKYGLYYNGTVLPTISDNNNIYVSASPLNFVAATRSGTDITYATLAAYQAAIPSLDQLSKSENPKFIGSGQYIPKSSVINDMGANVGVTTDKAGAARGANPDPGAFEFNPLQRDAGLTWVSPATAPFTPGNNTITVRATNYGSNAITQIRIQYTDGVMPVPVNEQFIVNIAPGQYQDISFTTPFSVSNPVTLTATILEVNLSLDNDQSNDVAQSLTLCSPMNGALYTIDNTLPTGGLNFANFTDAVNRLVSCGISGPVVITVNGAASYTGQIIIPQIIGASSTNTITIEGNGRTLTSNGDANPTNFSTLRLNGADWMIFKNLTLTTTSVTNGYACTFGNSSDNNRFITCNFNASLTSTATQLAGIASSSSAISLSGGGNLGNNNEFNTCIITGGFFGISLNNLNGTVTPSTGTKILNCTIKEFQERGILHGNTLNTVISNCLFERTTRTTTATQVYAIYITGVADNLLIERNRIRNLYSPGLVTGTGTTYGIFTSSATATVGNEIKFYSNLITNIGTNGGSTTAINNNSNTNTKVYNNTISFISSTFSPLGNPLVAGIQVSSGANIDVQNNIINLAITQASGQGTKVCIYVINPDAGTIINNNNLFNSSSGGTSLNLIGQNGLGSVSYATLPLWQAAFNLRFDQQSYSVAPGFIDPAGNNYAPSNWFLDNSAVPMPGVTSDILGTPRPSAPDMGAYEFSATPTLDFMPVSLVSPGTNGCYSSAENVVVRIKNNGNNTCDFTANPVSISCVVAGGPTLTGNPTGTLASKATMDVTLTGTVNMSAIATYTFTISTAVAGDAVAGNNNLAPATRTRAILAAGSITTASNELCEGRPKLKLTNASGGSIQWKESTVSSSGPWTSVGTDDSSYTPASDLTQTTYYKAEVTCNSTTLTSNVQTVSFNNNPVLLTTTGAQRCGIGPVTMHATANAGSRINWYKSNDAAFPLATGNDFTVPDLADTTTYYAAASFGNITYQVGKVTPGAYTGFVTGSTGSITFDALKPFTLKSVDVWAQGSFSGQTGTITIALQNSAGVIVDQRTVPVTAYAAPLYFERKSTLELNMYIPAGTNYQLVKVSQTAITSLVYDGSGNQYTAPIPYFVQDIVTQKTGTVGGGTSTANYAFMYNWTISTGCETARIPVTATFVAAPAITAVATNPLVCPGSATQLNIQASANPSYSYSWTPGNLSGNSVSVSPSVLTNYTVTALDNTAGIYSGCTTQAIVPVSTLPKVSVNASASPLSVCSGGNSQLAVAASTTASYAMSATTASPVAAGGTITTLSKTNFPGNTGGLNDGYFTVDLPFDFSYFGVSQNKVYINTNGFISFANGYTGLSSNSQVIIPHTGDADNAIYLAWKNWDITVSGSIQYFTIGAAPNRIFVVKYISVPPFVAVPPYAGNTLNGQIELYESNGKIELFLSQTDNSTIKTLGIENALGIGAFAPSQRNGTAFAVTSAEQWEFLPFGGSLSYSWTPNTFLDDASITTPFASFIFSTTSFTAAVTDASGGCSGSGSVVVATGDPLSAPINASVSTICAGQSSILSVTPTGGCAPYQYHWDDGTTTLSTGAFLSVSPSTTTTYNLLVTDDFGTEYPFSTTITVNPVPVVTATQGLICGTGPATLTASGAATYSWSPAANLSATTGSTVNSFTAVTATYTVTGTTALGCQSTALSKVTVSYVTEVNITASSTAVPMNGSSQLTAIANEIRPATKYYTLTTFTTTPYSTRTGPGITVINSNAQLTPNFASGNQNDGGVVINLPFTFKYFGNEYTQMSMCTNGWVAAGDMSNIDPTNSRIGLNLFTTQIPNRTLAAWFKDLGANFPTGAGSMRHGLVGPDVYAFQWDKMNANSTTDGVPEVISYEILIYGPASGTPGRISYKYGQAAGINIYGATIGIEDAAGGSDHYLNALNNSSTTSSITSSWPGDGKVYEFNPAPASFTFAWTPSTFLNSASISNPLASAMTSTTTYTVTAANADGCAGTASVQVEVGLPLAATASSSGNNFCELLIDTLRATVNGGCQPYTYTWSTGSTVIGTTKNVTLIPSAGITTYTLTVTDACAGSATSSVTITVLPAPNVSVTKSGDICGVGNSATLTATGAPTYSWFPVNALNTEIGPVVTSTATVSTLYTVTGTGSNGCKRPVTIQLNVFPAVKVYPIATPSTICANDSSNLRANAVTDNGYSVVSIPHNPIVPAGPVSTVNFGTIADEVAVNNLPLPFEFDFFGNRYSTWSISSNGYIGFPTITNTSISQNFPLITTPNNLIAFCWADLNVLSSSGSSVTYYTTGTAPDRVFVISFNNVKFTGGNPPSGDVTGKIQLYEGSNVIEMHVTTINHGSVSTSSNSMGIENSFGTVGYAPPGRNRGEGGLNGYNVNTPEAWRYEPVMPSYVYSWTPTSFLDDAGAARPLASHVTSTTNFSVTVTNPGTNCSATGAVTVTAGVPLVATGSALISTTCAGDKDSLFASASGGRAPYSYSWSDGTSVVGTTNRIQVNPSVTTHYVVTVTDYCGVVTASAPVTILVNPLPTLAVTPPGGSICNGLPSGISMTASGANSYTWNPSIGLSTSTGAIVTASASATTTYTVTGINSSTGCVNKTTATISRTEFTVGTASASPAQVCASQSSQLNSLFAVKTNPALLITEVTQFGAGSVGATTPRPAYFAASENNFIEISNLDINPTNVGGLTFELWNNAVLNRSYTIPAGVVLQGHSVLVLHIGPGTDSPANNYYHTLGSNDPLSPTNAYGYLLKQGATIIDAVATTSTLGDTYAWPAASGVSNANWSGTIPFGSINSAGVVRVGGFDSNSAADWSYATNSERQSLGVYNNGYASNAQPAFTYAWSPANYLDDATLSNPVVSGSTGGTLNYTVTATDPASGCTSNASTTLTVTPLPTVTLSGPSSTCTGTSATLQFAFTGVGPWVYSYTDGATVFGPYTSNVATASAIVTPPGAAGSIVTYTPTSISDSRCDGDASSLSGSASITLSSYSSIAGISLVSNKPFNNICVGDNITISMSGVTSASLGTGAHWKWYTGSCIGGTAVAGSTDQLSITVNPTVTTMYYAKAEGACNTTGCVSMEVVVTSTPPSGNPGLLYTPSIAYAGASDSIVVNPVPGATFYHWTTNGNSNILFDGHAAPYESSSNKVNLTFVSPSTNGNGIGNYHIQFFAGNACGTTNSTNFKIRATVATPDSIYGTRVACTGQTKTYTVQPIVGAKSYQWSIGGGAGTITGNGTQTVNVIFTTLPATLCVHGVSAFGSAGPDLCLNVTTVTAAPGLIAGNAAPCQGGSEVYSIDPVDGANTYNWTTTVAGATINVSASGTSATVNYPTGSFAGSVCVSANSGCASSPLTCLPVVSGTTPSLGAITGPTEAICGATGVNYQVTSIGAANYTWNVPTGATISSGQGSNSILVDFTSTYAGGNITVVSTSPCGNANQSLAVTGAPSIPVFTEGETSACDQDFGYNVTSNGATDYTWTVVGGDVIETANANNIIVVWGSVGGSVSVVATNSCGSSAPAVLTITSNCRMTGSNNMLKALQAMVYPNPSQGQLTLQYNSPEESGYQLKVTDLTGRLLVHETIKAIEGVNRHAIDLGNVAKGVYSLSLENNSGEKVVIRLVID